LIKKTKKKCVLESKNVPYRREKTFIESEVVKEVVSHEDGGGRFEYRFSLSSKAVFMKKISSSLTPDVNSGHEALSHAASCLA